MAFVTDEERSEKIVLFGGINNINTKFDSSLGNQIFVIEIMQINWKRMCVILIYKDSKL